MIMNDFIASGVCTGTYRLVEDLASQLGGSAYSYVFIYGFILLFAILVGAISRSVLMGFLFGIVGLAIIYMLGSISCLPIPANITGITILISLAISLILGIVWISEKR